MSKRDPQKAALRGEPSYVWRAGQQRRLEMIVQWSGERLKGQLLENGCGIGIYLQKLSPHGGQVFGLEYDFQRAAQASQSSTRILNAAGENLPFPKNCFDLILSHEVIEHVQNDNLAVKEMVRALKPGGRLILFCPNRWHPFETHGFYWRRKYIFGNIPLLNYLPRKLRDRYAPHVEIYTQRDLENLFSGLPVHFMHRTVIFRAYDNIVARTGKSGEILRNILQAFENTPLRVLGLSHFWVVEKTKITDQEV
jgi:SAM-dependent methyltransferase